jgi:hypothetical protein
LPIDEARSSAGCGVMPVLPVASNSRKPRRRSPSCRVAHRRRAARMVERQDAVRSNRSTSADQSVAGPD